VAGRPTAQAGALKMPVGQQTFADLGGAVSDLFAGIGASTAANLKAQGIDIEAQGTQISAQSLLLQSEGDIAEGTEYAVLHRRLRNRMQLTQQPLRRSRPHNRTAKPL
jgi:hypothetical protein